MEEPRKWQRITASATEEDIWLLQAIAEDLERSEGVTSISAVIRRLVRQEASRRGLLGSGGELSYSGVVAIADAETEAYLRKAQP